MYTPRSHLVTAAALLLVVAAPAAWADQGAAPGHLTKDAPSVATTTTTPAATPVTTPAPQSAHVSPRTESAQPVRTVTRGTDKTLSTTLPATAAPTAAERKPARSSAAHSRSQGPRAASSGHTPSRRRAGGAAASRTRKATAREARPAPAVVHQSVAAPSGSARLHAAERPVHPKHDYKPATGFASISRAADRVVEVIPGILLLTLAALTALVLLLVIRSWLTERRKTRALEASYAVTVESLATAIEAKDHTTGGHIGRVRELGLLLAREIAPREAKNPQMAYGFLLHDIGKLAVPDAILRAPGGLSEDEWALMRRHPEEGVRMLSSIPFLDRALDVVHYHHERWDGSGYPDGLAGEEIPLWARIFSVVDALDAMTAERPYRARQSYESAREEIRNSAGSQFDPAVVGALERLHAADVERLLEPAQLPDREPLAELPGFEPVAV